MPIARYGLVGSEEVLTSTATSATAATGSAAGGLVGGLAPVGARADTSVTVSCVTTVNHLTTAINGACYAGQRETGHCGGSVPFSFWEKPPPERAPEAGAELAGPVPSALALPVLVLVLVTVFTGAGFSPSSVSLPVVHDCVNEDQAGRKVLS